MKLKIKKDQCQFIIKGNMKDNDILCVNKKIKSAHLLELCKEHAGQCDRWAANGKASEIFMAAKRWLKFMKIIKEENESD